MQHAGTGRSASVTFSPREHRRSRQPTKQASALTKSPTNLDEAPIPQSTPEAPQPTHAGSLSTAWRTSWWDGRGGAARPSLGRASAPLGVDARSDLSEEWCPPSTGLRDVLRLSSPKVCPGRGVSLREKHRQHYALSSTPPPYLCTAEPKRLDLLEAVKVSPRPKPHRQSAADTPQATAPSSGQRLA